MSEKETTSAAIPATEATAETVTDATGEALEAAQPEAGEAPEAPVSPAPPAPLGNLASPFAPSPGAPYMNPYLAGVLLGLTLLFAFLTLGTGLGASGAESRLAAWIMLRVAPAWTQASEYFGAYGPNPLANSLVFMLAGVFLGGLVSALVAERVVFTVERGPSAPAGKRLVLALAGGLLSGWAARLAQGCTSGQALTGGAQFMAGSLVFMTCLFASGFALAWLCKGQWKK